ncbi:di-heme oxidoredictase family protein, partial [Massilia sp. S19_KUP03_FR1]|uniref:di-heme oxidoredictase family protein n=1 Tax=Massilia sp. S19_KUP03_FR1 TaxID=3025503 RepID=UPI002FCDD5F5
AKDADGAVGKLQIIADPLDATIKRVGRFGWRGTSATVLQQTSAALNSDMGVTSAMYPTHGCGLATDGTACRTADAKGAELSEQDVELIVRYASLLAVPAARHFPGQQPLGTPGDKVTAQTPAQNAAELAAENLMQARVKRGGTLFAAARCVACHTASLTTGEHKFAELRKQVIRPYTDLLLHDMGPELADNYPQGVATGQEWRTAPLWGIGLLKTINANTRYLHDGRARTIEEAVLWHGGQGEKSRERFKALSADDRQQMVDFINSL